MPLTYYQANRCLDNMANGQQLSGFVPYLGLSTSTPNRDGTNVTEPDAAAGYARVAMKYGSYSPMGNASAGGAANVDMIYFPETTEAWGTCTHYLIFDAATGGKLLAYGALDTAISPGSGKVPLLRAGALQFTMS